MMKLHVFKDATSASLSLAEVIAHRVSDGEAKVLGLATGNSPIQIYAYLVAQVQANKLSFVDVISFNLDEYLGLAPEHPASFAAFMQRHLFGKAPFNAHYIPMGNTPDPVAHALWYEQKIQSVGGIDLQLLGIGRNGHIGFNEPNQPLDSKTRVVTLSTSTLEANAADFPAGQSVPKHALTMGIATILAAKEIVLIATGAAKAKALHDAIAGDVHEGCPASALQRHQNVHIYADEAAAALL